MNSQLFQSKKFLNRLVIFLTIFVLLLVLLFMFYFLSTPFVSSASNASSTPVTLQQLRQIAATRGIHIGVTDGGFGSPLYRNTVPVEFNSITPEVVMKFENIHPCPPVWLINSNPTVSAWVENHGTERPPKYHCYLDTAADDEWEWGDTDARVLWAYQNDMGFRGHTFLWALQNPGWLIHDTVTLTVQEREQIMEDHITQVIQHYCSFSNIYQYDVVNEAFDQNGSLVPNPWSDIPDYIDKAFHHARNALDQCGRQDIKLFINETGFEYGSDKANAIYNYLEQLLISANPTPIDGIGFQTHTQQLDSTTPAHDTSALILTMDRFGLGLGLETVITETDLPIAEPNTRDWFEEQADWYGGRMLACLLAVKCTGYTVWGTHDGASWRNWTLGDVDPLMFEDASELVYNPMLQQCVTPHPDLIFLLEQPYLDDDIDLPWLPTSTPVSDSETAPTPTFTVTSQPTPDEMYCPKPAYGAVYSVLYRGISKMYIPLTFRESASAAPVFPDPYPPPELEAITIGTPYPPPNP